MTAPLSRRATFTGLLGVFFLVAGCSAAAEKSWKLAQMTADGREVVIPANVEATITLAADGSVSGYSGVNTFTGKCERSGGSIRWTTPFRSTRRGGSKEHMDFERAFLAVLQACDSVAEEKSLTLSGVKGKLEFGSR